MSNIFPGLPQPLLQQCIQTHVNSPLLYEFKTPWTRANAQNIKELNTTITPQTPTSKVLISLSVSYEPGGGGSPQAGAFYLVRRVDGVATEIGSAPPDGARSYGLGGFDYDANASTTATTMINYGRSFLDTPNTTLPVTYELWAYSTNANNNTNLAINRTNRNDNNTYNPLTTSQMILQEFFA
jgi:hypothetical protein